MRAARINMISRIGGPGTLAALGVTAVGLVGLGSWIALHRRRLTPEQREQRRRLAVFARGRWTDATIVEVEEKVVHYTYSVGGVDYRATQDLKAFGETLPEDLGALVGPVTLKYLPENPANSIVYCEGWSGLRNTPPEKSVSLG